MAQNFGITEPTVCTVGYKYIVGFTDLGIFNQPYFVSCQIVKLVNCLIYRVFEDIAFVCPEIAVAFVCGLGKCSRISHVVQRAIFFYTL